jgi:uncharacterized protein DUF3168
MTTPLGHWTDCWQDCWTDCWGREPSVATSHDRSVELFEAIFDALNGDAALFELIGSDVYGNRRIYDSPPQGALPPYVVIGDETASDYGSSAGDAQEHTVTIHVWSEQPSTLQCKRIMAAVRDCLHDRTLNLDDGNCVYIRQEFKETFRDPDGVSHHGVMRYRALTEN